MRGQVKRTGWWVAWLLVGLLALGACGGERVMQGYLAANRVN